MRSVPAGTDPVVLGTITGCHRCWGMAKFQPITDADIAAMNMAIESERSGAA
jgi:hypothetical protein